MGEPGAWPMLWPNFFWVRPSKESNQKSLVPLLPSVKKESSRVTSGNSGEVKTKTNKKKVILREKDSTFHTDMCTQDSRKQVALQHFLLTKWPQAKLHCQNQQFLLQQAGPHLRKAEVTLLK